MAPSPNTKSTSTTETVRGEHLFNITGFSTEVQCASGPATFLTSDTFSVNGLDWAICFYPADGFDEFYVSVFVRLTTENASARALFDLRLVDRATGGLPHSVRRSREPVAFVANKAKKRQRGARAFMSRSELRASPYLHDDCLTVECVLDVVQEPWLTPTTTVSAEILGPPPSDLWKHLGQLMQTQEGADVTFNVQGEAFHAHRIVLAARSPVFKVELSGSSPQPDLAVDSTSEIVTVTIPDMRPPVFKALLHFIYTDTLPSLDDLAVEEHQELVQDLLKAADRYAMGRLKQICTLILHKSLDWKTMADVLAFAGCEALGDACVQFAGTEG